MLLILFFLLFITIIIIVIVITIIIIIIVMYIYFFCFSAVFVLPRTAKIITLPSQRNHSSTLILSQIALTANFI